MSRLKGAIARMRSLLRAGSAESRMTEEFEFHIDQQTEKNIALGMTPEEARQCALLEFGGEDRHRETMREERRTRLLSELSQDARYTVRSLRHSRGFAVTAVLVIALGVGATTALFSLANALLFRPLSVSSPDELHMLQEVRRGAVSIGPEGRRIPYSRYEQYRDATGDLFTGLAGHASQTYSMRTESGARPVQSAITSGNYFEVLGLRPALGRFYDRDDEPVVVLSQRFWQDHFGGDPDAVGRVIHLDGRPFEVAGVASSGFNGTTIGLGTAVWLPFRAAASADASDVDSWVGMFGRIRDGVTVESAAAPLSAVATRMPPDDPNTTVERAYLAPLTGLPEGSRAQVGGFLGMLVAAGFLVLLIAAANVAALLLARALARQREIALRLALGAGRFRLVRQLLTESTALFLAGGIGGIALAYGTTTLLSRITVPGFPLVIDVAPDERVLAFALAISGLTGIVFGLAPALNAVRPDLVVALKDGAASGASARTRGRSIFVGAQLSFAMLLLITAGLFVRGLQKGLSVDPGFRSEGVVVGSVNLAPHGYDEDEGRRLQEELLRRVRALPEVESAALARTVLLASSVSTTSIQSVGSDPIALSPAFNVVDTAYFGTLGIELVAGRGFTAADGPGAPDVVVVNEMLAEQLWPGRNPIGQRLRRGEEHEVIGVARDGQYVELNEEHRPFAFFASAQNYSPSMTHHVRGRGDNARLIQTIRDELRTLDPDIALEMAMPLPSMIGFLLIPHRFAAALIGVFGILGLVLAGAGVYGVMSFQVAQRMREFGIRIALGARSSDVMRLVLGRGAIIAVAGAVVGAALAAAVTRLLTGMLFGLSPLDPVTFGGVGLTLAVVVVLASWVPARRALRVDPTVSLRSD